MPEMTLDEYISYMDRDEKWALIVRQDILNAFENHPDAPVVRCVGRRSPGEKEGTFNIEAISVKRPGDLK